MLERRFSLVTRLGKDGAPRVSKAARRALAGWDAPVVTVGALEPVVEATGRVLLRADGIVCHVVLIDVVRDDEPLTARLPLDDLVDIGRELEPLTGSINRVKMPVTFEIIELFSEGLPRSFVQESARYARRGVGKTKVAAGIVAFDTRTGRSWSNFPGLVRWSHVRLVRRAWREREMSRERREAILARTGFQPAAALVGIAVGAALGTGATWLLLRAGSTSGELYGGAIVMASAIAAAIALKACRVVHSTVVQAAVTGTSTGLCVLWFGAQQGVGVGLGGLLTLAFAIMLSVVIGAVDNPQGNPS